MIRALFFALATTWSASAFISSLGPARRVGFIRGFSPAAPDSVIVKPDAATVAEAVFAKVDAAAQKAVALKGSFALAIPGGSILKMLANTQPAWADKTTVCYVNHKCVSMDDAELATHAKAKKLFLDGWTGVEVITLTGTADSAAEAAAYEVAMKANTMIPRTSDGLPCFDMMLIGVGDDGHIGSLYPDREEVTETGPWVLPVDMKTPGSITLSLPVMTAAKEVVIAACGVSDKYPQGKSAGMARAIEGEETTTSFPASGLRSVATWIIDEAAGSRLSSAYTKAA